MDTEEIRPGDVVKLIPTATYYDGRIIPAWVKKERWIVSSVKGNRAVIDRNVGGTNAICSPVNVKNLQLVR